MSDLQMLLLIFGVVYAWECVHWLRRGSVAFLQFWGPRWKLTHPAGLLGNQAGGFVISNLAPPLGSYLAANQLPISISPEGVLAYVAQCVNPGWRPPQSSDFIRFDNIKSIESRSKNLYINGKLFLKTSSPNLALFLAELLKRLQKIPLDKRSDAIKSIIQKTFDIKTVRDRLKALEPLVNQLRLFTNALFFYLFCIVPTIIWRFGWSGYWIQLLAGLLLLTITITIFFYRAHKKLYPLATDERFTQTCLLFLSPVTCTRAHDALSGPLLTSMHPLAVAQALLPEDQFHAFARHVVLELRHPCLPTCPAIDPDIQSTELQARTWLIEAAETFLSREGVKLDTLTKQPVKLEDCNLSFCPRCEAQFTKETGICADCGGIPLSPFSKQTKHPVPSPTPT